MPTELITGLRGADLGVLDVAAHARFCDFVFEYTTEVEKFAAGLFHP